MSDAGGNQEPTEDAVPDDALGGRDRAEILLELWKLTTARRTERRSYEWKIAFGLWASLLLTAQLVASKGQDVASGLQTPGEECWVRWGSGGILLLIVGAHAVYLMGASLGFEQDRKIAMHYEARLADLAGAATPEGPVGKRKGRPLLWVSVFQVLITAALASVVFLLVSTVILA